MFLGKYNDHAVLAKGNVWIPDAKLSKKFATVLGEEVNQFLYLKKKKMSLMPYKDWYRFKHTVIGFNIQSIYEI